MSEEKVRTLLELIENVEQYTDAELAHIFADEDMRDGYETLVMVRQACQNMSRPHLGVRRHTSLWRMASSLLVLLVVAALGYAAYYMMGLSKAESSVPAADTAVMSAPEREATDKELAGHGSVVFEDQTLQDILNQMSAYYHVGVRYEEDSLKGLRLYFNWDPSEDIGHVLILLSNFDHINLHLENDTIVVKK